MYTPGDIYTSSPPFTTACYGDCITDGWRQYSTYADSGLQASECQSVLMLDFKTRASFFPATISFVVSLVNPTTTPITEIPKCGIEVYIDGGIQDVPFSLSLGEDYRIQLTIDTSIDDHTIMWVYYQSEEDPPLLVTLKDIKFFSSEEGVSEEQTQCPAGSYNKDGVTCLPCEPGSYSTGSSDTCTLCPSGYISPQGAVSCVKCNPGTTSFSNVCKPACKYTIEFTPAHKDTFDLRSLRGSVSSIYTNFSKPNDLYYEINLCDKSFSDNCYEDDCWEQSYVFVEYKTADEIWQSPKTLGSEFEFNIVTDHEDFTSLKSYSSYHTFDIKYTSNLGRNVPDSCPQTQVTLQFYCSVEVGRGEPKLTRYDQCFPVFSWNTTYACPTCTEDDIIKEYSACIDNKRLIFSRFSRPCNGENMLPPTVTEPCESVSVGRTTALLSVAIVLIILSIGLSLAILFFKQKRELQIKYKQLKGENNLDDSDSSDLGLGKRDGEEIALEEEESLPEVSVQEDQKEPI